MEIEDVISTLGGFGRYQAKLCVFVSIIVSIVYLDMVVLVLLLAVPSHKCTTYEINNTVYRHDYMIINSSTPFFNHQNKSSTISSYITLGDDPTNTTDVCDVTLMNGTIPCVSWTYDTSEFDSTAVTEFNWVCSHGALRSHAFMVFMIGMLAGSFASPIGDRYGRKVTIFVSNALQAVSAASVLLSRGFYSFVTTEFIVAVTCMPLISSACSLGVEMLDRSKRYVLIICMGVIGGVWFMIVVGAAYFIRNWRYIQLLLVLSNLSVPLWWWFIVESPRWLMTRGRRQEAIKALKYVARANGMVLPEGVMDNVTVDDTLAKPSKDRVWHLFYPSRRPCITLLLMLVWLATMMIFFGLNLSAANIHGNIYVNCLLSAAAEIPPALFLYYALKRVGRKPLLAGGLIGAGLFCLASSMPLLIDKDVTGVTITLAMLGKAVAMVAFTLVYIYSLEFYPTSIRAAVMGLFNISGRIGCIISPYVANMGDFIEGRAGKVTPLLILGGVAVIVGLLTISLPETMGQQLPDTIEESRHLMRSKPSPGDNLEMSKPLYTNKENISKS